MRWAGHEARMGESRGVYGVLMEESEGKRSLGRPKCRWEGNIKMDLRKVECGALIGLIGLRIGKGCMCL